MRAVQGSDRTCVVYMCLRLGGNAGKAWDSNGTGDIGARLMGYWRFMCERE